jgi:hypothetical protein
MKLLKGERWCCENDACGAELLVLVSSNLGGDDLRCCCGSRMKRPSVRPSLKNGEKANGIQPSDADIIDLIRRNF